MRLAENPIREQQDCSRPPVYKRPTGGSDPNVHPNELPLIQPARAVRHPTRDVGGHQHIQRPYLHASRAGEEGKPVDPRQLVSPSTPPVRSRAPRTPTEDDRARLSK